jgi:hypothetical protein
MNPIYPIHNTDQQNANDKSKINDLTDKDQNPSPSSQQEKKQAEAEAEDGGTSLPHSPSKDNVVSLPVQYSPIITDPDSDIKKDQRSDQDTSFIVNSKEMKSIDSLANNNINTSCNSKDNSSDNSNYNSSVQKSSEYVKKKEEYVKDSELYVKNSAGIRENSGDNTCKVDFTDLEIFQQYTQVLKIDEKAVIVTIDDSKDFHFFIIRNQLNDGQSEKEMEELVNLLSPYAEEEWACFHNENACAFIVYSSENTIERIDRFMRKFKTFHIDKRHSMKRVQGIRRLMKLKPIPLTVLSEYRTIKERTLSTNLHRILWDDDLIQCLSKVIRFYTNQKKRPVEFAEAEAILRELGFTNLFWDHRWQLKLDQLVKKYEHSFNKNKLQVNPVFLEAFTYILQSEIYTQDLFGKNQGVTIEEVQFILYKITKKVYTEGKPCVLARNYFCKFAKDFEAHTGRKWNDHKLAQITRLLDEYGYITKIEGHHTPSIYDIGPNNPFYEM